MVIRHQRYKANYGYSKKKNFNNFIFDFQNEEDISFSGLEPEEILGVTKNAGEVCYLIKWLVSYYFKLMLSITYHLCILQERQL